MPIAFLIVGILLIVVGLNNKLGELGGLVKDDFQPSNTSTTPFHIWLVALFIVGSLGYVRSLKPFANAFIALILIAMILSNKGFIANFTGALNSQAKGQGDNPDVKAKTPVGQILDKMGIRLPSFGPPKTQTPADIIRQDHGIILPKF